MEFEGLKYLQKTRLRKIAWGGGLRKDEAAKWPSALGLRTSYYATDELDSRHSHFDTNHKPLKYTGLI